jgi:hypothetical protein
MSYIVVSLAKGRHVVTYCSSQNEACHRAILWEYQYGIPSWVETL